MPCSPVLVSALSIRLFSVGSLPKASLVVRIQDCQSKWVVTADEGLRGGRFVPLKANLDEALKQCPDVGTVIVVRHAGRPIAWVEGRDIWHHEAIANVSPACVPTEMKMQKIRYSFSIPLARQDDRRRLSIRRAAISYMFR